MYFEKFPTTYYSLDDLASVQIVRNIFLRATISDEIKSNFSLYDEYDVMDGETPEIVADRVYGNSMYHWLVLHLNDILDPRFDWPLSNLNLQNYCQGKYTDINAIHHYEDGDGLWVNSDYPSATAISNYTYEDRINESKRRIKLLKPQYVEAVIKEFTNKIQDVNG